MGAGGGGAEGAEGAGRELLWGVEPGKGRKGELRGGGDLERARRDGEEPGGGGGGGVKSGGVWKGKRRG